uniref:Uncharacterized protein n=1 Tax=Salarias fasciatus TaxID=181472 RepID=A0A672IM52_SALFA
MNLFGDDFFVFFTQLSSGMNGEKLPLVGRFLASLSITDLNESVQAEREMRAVAENTLKMKAEKVEKLEKELENAENALQEQRDAFEKEKSSILEKHREALSCWVTTMEKMRQELEEERSRWTQEMSTLRHTIIPMKQQLEYHVREMEETKQQLQALKKNTLWRRIVQFFKRS